MMANICPLLIEKETLLRTCWGSELSTHSQGSCMVDNFCHHVSDNGFTVYDKFLEIRKISIAKATLVISK